MSEDIRKMIDKVNDFDKLLIENNRLKCGGIIKILNNKGIKVSPKEVYYNGSGYREKYDIIGSNDVDGWTHHFGAPSKIKAQGFICKNGVLQNFFSHNGSGFDTFIDINDFLKAIIKDNQPNINESYSDESLPLSWGNTDDVVIKRQVYDKIMSDLYKANTYFLQIKPKNDPEYLDKFNRLNRAYNTLTKAGN